MKKLLCMLLLLLLTLPLPSFAGSSAVSEGDTVIFGRYEQDADPDNGPEPLQWLVLEADEDTLLLITQYEIAFRSYSEREDQMVSWADSDLRAWLNDRFLTLAFTEEERTVLAETPLYTPGSVRRIRRMGETLEMTAPECDTIDRVFVLSSGEIGQYFFFGSTESDAASEHRLSMPSYSVLLRLALQGRAHWEAVRDIPAAQDYADLTNRFLPAAAETEEGWTLPVPSVREYAEYWKDLETFSPREMWPWLLREQGMIWDCYWDGLGSMSFYDWYCWDATSVRPALRVSRRALEQGLVIAPQKVYPQRTASELTGVWKAEEDGMTEYLRFDEDGCRLTAVGDGSLFAVSFRMQELGQRLILSRIGTQGQLIEWKYRIDEDTLTLIIGEQKTVLVRADASEWPQSAR